MTPILPGASIGVLGSGQLGRMFAIAARRMGYRVHTYSPDTDTPTGQVSDVEITGSYSDLDRVCEFARNVSVVTFEFENVPAETAAACAGYACVRPAGAVLHTTQHRLREKTFLRNSGLPVTRFAEVNAQADLEEAIASVGCPSVLKTAGYGYDGKGQIRIGNDAQAVEAWDALGRVPAVLEAFVDFECELSVVAARGADGTFAHYGAVKNEHSRHILDVTTAPAPIDERIARQAVEIARAVLEKLDVVGVLCVEFFLTRDGRLLINELAPRPHNSGHFTFDASVTSQFEQQLRAVCGLPLGSTEQLRPAAMANILGDLWAAGEPDWSAACAFPHVKLHLYGKMEPRPGRKMGHLTALGDNAVLLARQAREALNNGGRRETAHHPQN
jgi:5-(carboxyamino)imidazole ribonucleotide synthase